MIHQYRFGPFSTQTFTYPVGTKVECVQRVDLQGRPETVYLLAVLTMRDQGRTFKLSM
ncbi:hypothetical protein [Larkinella humicola]|uniref:hypothetical protein n=1 Tax=Larkinella humicola TaxID=2607654 RepID=UPI00178127F0|nr:hypothetical protein [Larkinella humicola]